MITPAQRAAPLLGHAGLLASLAYSYADCCQWLGGGCGEPLVVDCRSVRIGRSTSTHRLCRNLFEASGMSGDMEN